MPLPKPLKQSRLQRARLPGPMRWSCLMALTAALGGCAGLPGAAPQPADTPAAAGELRIPRVLMVEGLRKLREHRYEDASRVFNAALKFDPAHAQLHFLNGLAYHLLYLRGNEPARELAATGYEMALGVEPAHYAAALQLGRLQFEAKRYDRSVDAFRLAAEIEPDRGEAHLGLAMAAYHDRDLALARAAAERATGLLPGSADALRVEAMVRAGLGDHDAALGAVRRYASLEADPAARSQLERRVGQWREWHASTPAGDAVVLAQNTAAPVYTTPDAAPAAPAAPTGARDPALPRWFECDNTTATQAANLPAAGAPASADETAPLPALPAPCKGAGSPRMAILDVTIVRTEDSSATSNGINLLNGLNYMFSRSRQISDVLTRTSGAADARTITDTRQRGRSLGTAGSTAGISYSLNIANATDARSEVLAQPSLLALDRQSSTFFSGRNITLGIAGQAGGASTLSDKAVGVSLAVTPTFMDDDTMLVSARAARSFLEQVDVNIAFGQSMQTSRNSVTANVVLKFGQTLVLSGLAEQEVQRATDGVPVLQDIPGLQYLFRNKATQTFTRSVLVLITPRRPATEPQQLASELAARTPGRDPAREALVQQLQARQGKDTGPAPGPAAAYRHALDNRLFLQFRAGDVKADDWSAPSRLDNFFRQLGTSLYF